MKDFILKLNAQMRILKADYIQDLRDFSFNAKRLREVHIYYEDKIMELENQISNYESFTKTLIS